MTKLEWRDLIADTIELTHGDAFYQAEAIIELLDQHGYGKPLPTKEWAPYRDDVQSNG